MHTHQLLDHPLFDERPTREVLEPFGFQVNIETVEPPIDPAFDKAEDLEAYANDPVAYIAGLSFEHPAGFTEIHRNENEDDIFSVAVRAKTVFAQLLLCADSSYAGDNRTFGASYVAVWKERMRQISTEGFSRERDDGYVQGELASAAACYVLPKSKRRDVFVLSHWPWSAKWWKPSTDPRRNLVKAGALILAEIERLDRAADQQAGGCQVCGAVPGQYHSPECPAVNAFQAGRIPPAQTAEQQGGEA